MSAVNQILGDVRRVRIVTTVLSVIIRTGSAEHSARQHRSWSILRPGRPGVKEIR